MKKYTPTTDMRINPLSKTEGGETVVIIFKGYCIEYTNIKSPMTYITSVLKRSNKEVIGYIFGGKTTII